MIDKMEYMQDELDRTKREIQILYEVSQSMRSTLELQSILYIILTGVTSHRGLGFNRAVLFLYDKKTEILNAEMAIAPNSGEDAQRIWDYVASENQAIDDLVNQDKITENYKQSELLRAFKNFRVHVVENNPDILSKAFFRGTPWHLTETKLFEYNASPLFNIFQTDELLILPLKAKDEVNGIIIADNAFSKNPITDNDIKISEMLANQAGLAIENSRLYEMVIHQSHTDYLTRVFNHGFFQNQLEKELKVAERKKHPLSLMMLDIDNFKQLNDSFGHQIGDIVLIEISKLLQNESRERDFICRYGGEEFAIIFPETNKQDALMIAERIRQKVQNDIQYNVEIYPPREITVSIGIASFPEDSTSKSNLISSADKAMYTAKFSGKNQVISA